MKKFGLSFGLSLIAGIISFGAYAVETAPAPTAVVSTPAVEVTAPAVVKEVSATTKAEVKGTKEVKVTGQEGKAHKEKAHAAAAK